MKDNPSSPFPRTIVNKHCYGLYLFLHDWRGLQRSDKNNSQHIAARHRKQDKKTIIRELKAHVLTLTNNCSAMFLRPGSLFCAATLLHNGHMLRQDTFRKTNVDTVHTLLIYAVSFQICFCHALKAGENT